MPNFVFEKLGRGLFLELLGCLKRYCLAVKRLFENVRRNLATGFCKHSVLFIGTGIKSLCVCVWKIFVVRDAVETGLEKQIDDEFYFCCFKFWWLLGLSNGCSSAYFFHCMRHGELLGREPRRCIQMLRGFALCLSVEWVIFWGR